MRRCALTALTTLALALAGLFSITATTASAATSRIATTVTNDVTAKACKQYGGKIVGEAPEVECDGGLFDGYVIF